MTRRAVTRREVDRRDGAGRNLAPRLLVRVVGSIGPWPSLTALAVLVALAATRLLPFASPPARAAGADATELVWTAVPDAWLEGLARLRAGDAPAALQALRAAEAWFDAAPPELLRARLAAAIAAADGVDAELTVEKLALRTGGDEDLRAFVTGLAEFARSRFAARQAKLPGADPFALDRAIRHAGAAARAFETACLLALDRDWPAARRNCERALAARQELVRQQEQQKRDQQREQDPDRPQPQIEPLRIEQELQRPDDAGLLSPQELQAVLRRLASAEDEKRGVRRAVRDARSAGVEQDW